MKLFFVSKSENTKAKRGAHHVNPSSNYVVKVRDKVVEVSTKDEEDPKKIVIQMFGPDSGKKDTSALIQLLIDEDEPLSEEEKRLHYKSSKNVMAARKIRELMNANKRATLKQQIMGKSSSDFKTKFVVGLALTLQIVAVLLIFI